VNRDGYGKNEIITGLFVVVAALVFALFSFRLGGLGRIAAFQGPSLACECTLATVENLTVGAKVAVAGRRVGSVSAMEFVEVPGEEPVAADTAPDDRPLSQAVRVRFELRDSSLRLDPETARVRLRQDGFLGQFFLDLDPGTWVPADRPPRILERAGPGTSAGDWLVLRTAPAGGMDDLMEDVAGAVGRLESVLRRLDDSLAQGDGNLLPRMVEDLSEVVTAVRSLLDREQPDSLQQRLLEPLASFVARLEDRLFEETLPQAEQLVADGRLLASDARRAVQRAEAILSDAEPRVSSLLANLDETAAGLERTLDGIEADTASLLEQGNALLIENRAAVAETIRRLRDASWEAEMALRKIRANPAYLLFGDDEPDLRQRPVDVTGLRDAGRALPYRQRDEGDD
jgi:ABC-type transporter Mla subunit MlaD